MLLLVFGALRAIWALRRDPQFVSLALLAVVAIVSGTAFYSLVEGLRFVDALYFSVVTLTTVGYGDFAPETDVGKLFTAVYALVGVGILLAFITTLATKVSQMPLLPSQKGQPKRSDGQVVSARSVTTVTRPRPGSSLASTYACSPTGGGASPVRFERPE
jgi:voltage-gated potassium channel